MLNLNRDTLRWLLEVTGFLFLLVACFLHSWTWDAAGITLLAASVFINIPPSVFGDVVGPLLMVGASPSFAVIPRREEQLEFDYQAPAYARCAWALKPCGASAHVRSWEDCH